MSADADLDLIFAIGADTFTVADVTVQCDFMEHDAVLGASGGDPGVVCGAGYVLVRSSLFPNLQTDQVVQLNGQDRHVVQKMRIQDGAVLQVMLGDAQDVL